MRINNPKFISILIAMIIFILYIYTIISYAERVDLTNQKIITKHARVIFDDIWRFDQSSSEKYLKLAIEANYYKNIAVTLQSGKKYLSIDTIPNDTVEKILIQYNLIQTKGYSADIIRDNLNLGTLSAVVYVRNIYYYFNSFLVCTTLFLVVAFIIYLQSSRRLLNRTVLDRTAELQAKEEDLRTTINSIGDAVMATDVNGCISRVNPVALDLLNSTNEDILGQSISDKLTLYNYNLKTKISLDVPFIIENKQIDQINTVACLSNQDSKQIVRVAASYVYNRNICTGLVIVISDITETKNLEHKLIQSQRMESIGLMAGGVAHDLNNILSGIIGYPQLILRDLPKDSNLRKPIKAIMESGKRAATVVADLLTVARGAASAKEVQNLNSLIQEYLNSLEYKKLISLYPNIKYQCKLKAENHNILCSPVHIKKCLMNLVTNAAEIIVDEGNVIVSTYNQHIDDSTNRKQDMEEGDYIVLSVQDTGAGISNMDLEHIFEPFYTKKVMGRSGTGLGLTVVWNTMKDHDGKVFVESSEKGTCFQLYFPVTREKVVVQNTNNNSKKFIGNSEHILIVDDEPHLCDIACQMLQTIGYKVDSVSSGKLAIKFLKENPIDLIVLDMLMEPGINGRQTYEEIIKLYPKQKAIIASGFSESDDVKATLQLGAKQFIKKPYSINQLAQAVKEALNT